MQNFILTYTNALYLNIDNSYHDCYGNVFHKLTNCWLPNFIETVGQYSNYLTGFGKPTTYAQR